MSSYDYRTGLIRTPRQKEPASHWFSTLLALIILLLCLAVGMVGLILPIIPGFLFLILAALIAAKLFPAIDTKLRQYTWFRSYLEKSANFSTLTWRGKTQLICWFVLKALLDSILWMLAALAWFLRFVFSAPEKFADKK